MANNDTGDYLDVPSSLHQDYRSALLECEVFSTGYRQEQGKQDLSRRWNFCAPASTAACQTSRNIYRVVKYLERGREFGCQREPGLNIYLSA